MKPLVCLVLLIRCAFSAAAEWSTPVWVAKGGQIDVVADKQGVLHLLSSEYVQIDKEGSILVREAVGDGQQAGLDFPPAIAVGEDAAVHIVTRHGGSWNAGHSIRYRRRNTDGEWDIDIQLGEPVHRNYVVGVAVTAEGRVFAAHSEKDPNVNQTSWIHLYEIVNGASLDMGLLNGRYMRLDDGYRMRGTGHYIHIAAGNPWPGGSATYFVFLPMRMAMPREVTTFSEGTGRRGFPWLYGEEKGFFHLTYGSHHSVWYNKITYDGRRAFRRDVEIAGELGDWHLSVGLSVVAASDDGTHVVVVIVKTDGTKEITAGEFLWRHSPLMGMAWSELKGMGFPADAGEGRRRPVLTASGNQFRLCFYMKGAIHMSTLDLAR